RATTATAAVTRPTGAGRAAPARPAPGRTAPRTKPNGVVVRFARHEASPGGRPWSPVRRAAGAFVLGVGLLAGVGWLAVGAFTSDRGLTRPSGPIGAPDTGVGASAVPSTRAGRPLVNASPAPKPAAPVPLPASDQSAPPAPVRAASASEA